MSKIRKNGVWLDELAVRKRVHEAWVDAVKDYYVRTPNISGTPPFAFKSDGQNLRDWSITGQTAQASTPTPANPVAVEGVGERTENLFDRTGTYSAGAFNNVYLISGLDTSLSYTCSTSLARISGAQAACIYFSQSTSISSATNGVWSGEEKTFTPNENGELYVHVRNTAASGAPAIADDVIAGNITIMLNTGSTALPYEPYGVKIPVNVQSGNLFDISDFSIGTTSFITKQVTLEPNTTYTMSSNCPLYNGGALIVIGNIGESFSTASNGVYPNHPITRTADANGKLLIGLRTNGSDYTLSDYDTMLNRGSTPLPYQPYSNTTTNIYLGSASTTRRIKKLVLTGSASDPVRKIGSNAPYAYYYEPTGVEGRARNACLCTHVPFSWSYSGETPAIIMSGTFDRFFINFGKTTMDAQPSGNTVEGFKEFCAQQYANGTPVTVWYVLATPETSVVNEPLMKIGTYSDEITKTGTGVDIPTTNGSNTLAVNTTVQPSGMTIQSISQWV